MAVNNSGPANPYANVDWSKVDYSKVDWNKVFGTQPSPAAPASSAVPQAAPATPGVTQTVTNPQASLPLTEGQSGAVTVPQMSQLTQAAQPAAATTPAAATGGASAATPNTDVKGPANGNAAGAGPSDPKITLVNTTDSPRTYTIASNNAPDETTTVPPHSSSVLRPVQNWSGAITDSGGTRQEFTMNKDYTTYDSDFEYSGNNSTVRPDSGAGKTTGESDFLGKLNSSYAGLSASDKQNIFASGAITTSDGTANGTITGVHVTPDAKFQAYRNFITNDAKLNGYKFSSDDTNSITNSAAVLGQAFTITSS